MHNGRRRFIFVVALFVGAWVLTSLPIFAAPFQPGQIFIAYDGSNIGVFADTVSLAGTQVQTLSVSTSSFTMATTLSGGGGIALDEQGNLYVTVSNFKNQTNRRGIIKFNPVGEKVLEIDGKTTTIDFRGLAVSAANDRIYVATDSGIRVWRASDGTRMSNEDFGGNISFRDVVLDVNGNLYGMHFTTTGNTVYVRKWATGNFTGSGTLLFSSSGNPDPRALVLDQDGNLYITVNTSPIPSIRKFSQAGTLLATYTAPSGTGTLIGLDYDPGVQKLFASHTATGSIGQILALDPKTGSWTAFGPNNLFGVRWLAVYPTPEPTIAILLAAGWLFLRRRSRR